MRDKQRTVKIELLPMELEAEFRKFCTSCTVLHCIESGYLVLVSYIFSFLFAFVKKMISCMSDREKKIRGGGSRNDKLYNKRSTRPTYPGIYIRTVSIVKRYFGHVHVCMYIHSACFWFLLVPTPPTSDCDSTKAMLDWMEEGSKP